MSGLVRLDPAGSEVGLDVAPPEQDTVVRDLVNGNKALVAETLDETTPQSGERFGSLSHGQVVGRDVVGRDVVGQF